MSIHRRRLTGKPLLVASAGAVMTLASCMGTTSGNLVAPPMVELCVTVDPPEATAAVDGNAFDEDLCSNVYEGFHTVTAEADGYQSYSAEVDVLGDTNHAIVMTPE